MSSFLKYGGAPVMLPPVEDLKVIYKRGPVGNYSYLLGHKKK